MEEPVGSFRARRPTVRKQGQSPLAFRTNPGRERRVKLNRFVRKPRLFRDESSSIAKSERKVILVFPSCDHRFKVWTGVPGLFQYQVYRALCIVCTEGYRASYRGRVFLVLEGPLSYDGRGLDLPGAPS